METKMAQIAIYLGADRIISACGLTTRENMEAIGGGTPGVATFRDPSLCEGELTAGRIDRARFGHADFETLLEAAIGSVAAESGVDPKAPGTGLVIATTKGNIDCLRNAPKPDPRCFIAESAQRVAGRLGFTARPVVISNACISGVAALVVARRMIEAGTCTEVIVAGADLLTEFVVAGFRSFKSVSETVAVLTTKPATGFRSAKAAGRCCSPPTPEKPREHPSCWRRRHDAGRQPPVGPVAHRRGAGCGDAGGDAGGGPHAPGNRLRQLPTARRPFTTTKWRAGPCIGPGWGTSP